MISNYDCAHYILKTQSVHLQLRLSFSFFWIFMSLYSWVQQQLKQVYTHLQESYSPSLLERILRPDQIIEISIPVTMDNGHTHTFTGYRSQHNNARWPYKGGIRFHPNVSKDEVMSLSVWMSLKCAVVGIPLGWGKWWVIVNPKELSKNELERLSRGYMRKMAPYIWADIDVPAPDVNTDSQIMAWMLDEYIRTTGKRTPGVITWKPLAIWGSRGRDIATALWGIYVLKSYLQLKQQSLAGKKIIIQGAWNAGLTFAQLALAEWAIIIGISDSSAGIMNPMWLDVEKVTERKDSWKAFKDFSQQTHIVDNETMLRSPCDILVPAALESQITTENAAKIQASLILELANGPVTPEADKILRDRSIPVIPDILANAGGVTVSYFEQVQNNTNYYRPLEEIQQKLFVIMNEATKDVVTTAAEHKTHLRDWSYIIALRRIFDAMKACSI